MLHCGILGFSRPESFQCHAYNFAPGPAMLPESVLRQAQAELLEFGTTGASILEISHRGADFMAVAQKAEADLRTLLAIPMTMR